MSLPPGGRAEKPRRGIPWATLRLALVPALVLLCASCQKPVQNDLCAVRGKVVFKDQQPFTGGKIAFHSLDEDEKFVLYAPIGPDGAYSLRYGKQPGAPAGRYKAVIIPEGDAAPALHRSFTRLDASRLEFTVKAGENVFDITVWK